MRVSLECTPVDPFLPPAPGSIFFFLPACLAQCSLGSCPPTLQRGCATPEHAAIRTVAGIKGGVVRQRYGRCQGKVPCLHAPKPVWRHSVREFHSQSPMPCFSYSYRACERRYRCCYPIYLLSSSARRMPSNDSTWYRYRLLHITYRLRAISSSLHVRWPSHCSVSCACTCTCNALPRGAADHSLSPIHML